MSHFEGKGKTIRRNVGAEQIKLCVVETQPSRPLSLDLAFDITTPLQWLA
jgi:hypothetical protein